MQGYISADDLFKYMKNNNFPRFKGSKSDMKGIREMLQAAYLTNPSNKNPEVNHISLTLDCVVTV